MTLATALRESRSNQDRHVLDECWTRRFARSARVRCIADASTSVGCSRRLVVVCVRPAAALCELTPLIPRSADQSAGCTLSVRLHAARTPPAHIVIGQARRWAQLGPHLPDRAQCSARCLASGCDSGWPGRRHLPRSAAQFCGHFGCRRMQCSRGVGMGRPQQRCFHAYPVRLTVRGWLRRGCRPLGRTPWRPLMPPCPLFRRLCLWAPGTRRWCCAWSEIVLSW
jgi:hypothetical protein